MIRIVAAILVIVSAYLIFVNLTSQYFEWDCDGNVSYRGEVSCQILPAPHQQNLANSFLLSLNGVDFNKSDSDCLNSVLALACFLFLNK